MKTLTIKTPVGTFTRKTNNAYTHIVVRQSPRALGVLEASQKIKFITSIYKRWIKDNGYAVTYHFSHDAALKAAQSSYHWDRDASVIGIYEVAA